MKVKEIKVLAGYELSPRDKENVKNMFENSANLATHYGEGISYAYLSTKQDEGKLSEGIFNLTVTLLGDSSKGTSPIDYESIIQVIDSKRVKINTDPKPKKEPEKPTFELREYNDGSHEVTIIDEVHNRICIDYVDLLELTNAVTLTLAKKK